MSSFVRTRQKQAYNKHVPKFEPCVRHVYSGCDWNFLTTRVLCHLCVYSKNLIVQMQAIPRLCAVCCVLFAVCCVLFALCSLSSALCWCHFLVRRTQKSLRFEFEHDRRIWHFTIMRSANLKVSHRPIKLGFQSLVSVFIQRKFGHRSSRPVARQKFQFTAWI